MLTAVCWKWNRPDGTALFESVYVNRLRAALSRQLHMDHELVCVTDDHTGIDGDVRIVPLPETYRDSPRCRRRMRIFDKDFVQAIGSRLLCLDLDVVLVGDITPLVDRSEPLVCWKVGYAQVYSGSVLLMTAGVMDGLWQRFQRQPEAYAKAAQPRGVGSDQAMLNLYLRTQPKIPHWDERDGFVTYFGEGYEKRQHLGVGPGQPVLPDGARIVVLGSADKVVMDEGRFDWIREHWGEPVQNEVAA